MQNTLDANGNLMATSTLKAPYFDPDQLGSYATVINSKFPFRTSVVNGVTKYEFDSTNAKDNVYFNWNGTTTSISTGTAPRLQRSTTARVQATVFGTVFNTL